MPCSTQSCPKRAACWSPGNARNGYLRRKERRGRIAVNFAAGLYFGQNRPGNTEQIEQIVVPLLRVDIEEHRTRRVRHVGHMRPTPRKPPDQPAVDRSEAELALLRALAHARCYQNPLDLGRREIGVQNQAGLLMNRLLVALAFELLAVGGGPAVLPHDRVIDRRDVSRSQITVVSR